MAPSYANGCVKLILKITVFLLFVFSTSITKQCTPKETERDGYAVRNVGIRLCQLKCAENGQCLCIEYNTDTLTCRISRDESREIKKKERYVILERDHPHVPNDSCKSSVCIESQRCLKTRSGKAVCVQDEQQNYPEQSPQLHEACRKGNLNRVRGILSQGLVNINSRDEKHGRTPLMVAAQEGHCEIFDFLIRKGANKSDVDDDCKNVLHWACKGGHEGMVRCVIPQYGIKVGGMSPLIQAVWKGYKDVFEYLVCTGSNVSKVDSRGNNILHHASLGRYVAVVKYIVSLGRVDINSRNKEGITPLMMAALGGHIVVFDFLVSKGGNPSHVDFAGHNILHIASPAGHIGMVKHILSQNLVDINARDKYGNTAAMKAKLKRKLKVYNLLVSRGCPEE